MEYEKHIVNKLFLIGNGFDLALGLKTSYNDFMFWLLKKYFLKSVENYERQSAPAGYKHYNQYLEEYQRDIVYGFSINNLFDILIEEHYGKHKLLKTFNEFNTLKDIFNFIEQDNIKVKIHVKNEHGLFQQIYNQANLGWVDIEGIYFNLIKNLVNDDQNKNKREIESYNEDLKAIILELNEYLKDIELDVSTTKANEYLKQFFELPDDLEVFLDEKRQVNGEQGSIYFLNFNYTNSLQNILAKSTLEFRDYTINHIHGSFREENDIIFGFGDEMDESYKKIEELNDNRFFEHIKSFHYFSNSNYRNLLSFLNSNYYQVCIYGHSCGLSDRIMLNEIFENENCKSIKIYFYEDKDGWNDFTTKTMDISRHFTSNKLMREKIVEFNPDNRIPQVKK